VTAPTASAHLARLVEGGLIAPLRQGRHRYFRLAHPDVAELLERLMGLAARSGHLRTRPGPRDPALRRARVCYDHLAGDLAVRLLESLCARGHLSGASPDLDVTAEGARLLAALGIDLGPLRRQRRPICRGCLDWSERRHHLGGALGAALLERFYAQGWARREAGGRVVTVTPQGEVEPARLLSG